MAKGEERWRAGGRGSERETENLSISLFQLAILYGTVHYFSTVYVAARDPLSGL